MPIPNDIYNPSSVSNYDIYGTPETLDTNVLQLPPYVLEERAAKAHFALRNSSPGFENLFNTFTRGGEPEVRNKIASEENIRYENIRLKLLRDTAAKLPRDVDPYVLNYLMGATARAEQDPNFALESVFARHWINDIFFNNKDKNDTYRRAFDKSVDEFLQLQKTSQDLVIRHQAFLKLNEDLQARYEDLPGAELPDKNSKLYAYVRNFSDIVNWYDIHNVIAPTTAITPGGLIAEQTRYAWTTPINNIPSVVDSVRDLFNVNPHAALELSNALIRYGSDDSALKNAFVAANIATSATIAGVGRVAGGVSRRLQRGFTEAGRKTKAPVEKLTSEALRASVAPSDTSLRLFTPRATVEDKIGERVSEVRSLESRIEQAYLKSTDGRYNTRGLIRDIRKELPDVSKKELDGVLKRMQREDKLILYRFDNQRDPEFQKSIKGTGLTIGKEPREILWIPKPITRGETPETVNREFSASITNTTLETEIAAIDTVQAAAVNKIDPQRALSKVGNTEDAAVIGAAKEIKLKLSQMDPEETLQPLIVNAPHTFNPNIYARAVDSASGVAASRLANKAINRVVHFLDKLGDTSRVPRLTEESLQQAIDITRAFDMKYFRDTNHALSNAYMSFSIVLPGETLTNVGLIKYIFGRPNATSFDSVEEAYTTATKGYKLPEGSFTIRQDGSGYHIVITKPIRETFTEVKDHLIETDATKVPNTWDNFLLRWFKSADSLTSLHDSRARKVATAAPSGMRAFAQNALKAIQKLGRDQQNELRKVLEYDRIWEDPVTGKIGTYQRTQQDFEKLFKELNNKLPTPEQTDAYNLTVQLNDFDYVQRSLDWLRDLHRQGAELVRFHVPQILENLAVDDNLKPTEWFMGRRINDIPWDSRGDAVIWHWDAAKNTGNVFHKLDKADDIIILKTNLRQKIRDGELQVIEVGNPKSTPLKKDLNIQAPVNYILADTFQFKPLKITDIAEYRPGGHVVYANRYYLKQPVIQRGYKGRLYYYGDRTIMGVESEKEAANFSKVWNKAQKLLSEGKEAELTTFLAKNIPDMPLKKFKKFYSGGGPGGGLDTEIPVKWVETNRDVFDVHPTMKDEYPGISEQLAAPDMMHSLDKRFIADRGQLLNLAKAEGTESNPLFRIESPQLINPYVALTRAMGNSIKGRWMGDYKALAAEHWIETFGDIMNIRKEELRNNPAYYLTRAKENYNYNADRRILNSAEEARQRILNFIGYRSDVGRDISYIEQKILDTVGVTGGREWQEYLQHGIMESVRDPVTHMRAFAFHMNMGMFNPVTFWVQLQTLTNILAIAPQHAFQSLTAYILQRGMLRTEDPKIWDHYAKIASKMGWNKDEFLESFQSLKRTEWYRVGGEVAWKDSVPELTPFKSMIGNFLDKGTLFFNEGERAIRMSGWNTAYREWRKANPNKTMTSIDESAILQRADDLGVNMTRASNASWNNGVLSIPTQYFSYQARLMEQIIEGLTQTGAKKLSRAETGRLLAGISMMYGIPTGMGAAIGFFPVYDDVKKRAIENNVNIDDNWFKVANEGLLSFIVSLTTGKDYNIADRYGPGGNDSIVQIFRGNKEWYEVLGAAPSTMASVLSSTLPIFMGIHSAVVGDGTFPHTINDFISASKEVKTANNALRAWDMFNTHTYTTKNGSVVNEVDNQDALTLAIFGLTPRSVTDVFSSLDNEKKIRESKEWYEPRIIKEIRQALKAYATGDDELGDNHLKRASEWTDRAGLTWRERQQIFRRSIDQNENLYELVERMRAIRKLTTPSRDVR